MTTTQTALGWIYLAVHVAVLPLLLNLLRSFSPDPIDSAKINLIYYCIGVAFCLTAMFTFLRRSFDRLVDNLRLCILTMLVALMIDYALSGVVALVLILLEGLSENPNSSTAVEMVQQDGGTVKAIAIFLAPIVEEILFRGVIFGSVRPRSRIWAYVASVVCFSLYHVWNYAAANGDFSLLLYALEYIPISVVLAWAYERSGCIWTNIFFHMGFNAMSYYILNTAGNLG